MRISNCKSVYFDPIDETHDKLKLLRQAIPEFFHCTTAFILSISTWYFIDDDTNGQLFHSKHFPNLRYFIHTGFDIELGITLNYYMECVWFFS